MEIKYRIMAPHPSLNIRKGRYREKVYGTCLITSILSVDKLKSSALPILIFDWLVLTESTEIFFGLQDLADKSGASTL